MIRNRWSKFWWQDWQLDPGLRASSYAAKGLWMDMLALMHTMQEPGVLRVDDQPVDLAKMTRMLGAADARTVARLVAELETNGVFSRDPDGAILSRRIRRDTDRSRRMSEAGKQGGNPILRRANDLSKIELNPSDKPLEYRVQNTEAESISYASHTPSDEPSDDPPSELPLGDQPAAEQQSQPPKAQRPKPAIRKPEHFPEWWAKYPRKEAKGQAEKAYTKAFRSGVDERTLYRGLLTFAWPDDEAFIPYPASWLNARRWEDEPSTKPPRNRPDELPDVRTPL